MMRMPYHLTWAAICILLVTVSRMNLSGSDSCSFQTNLRQTAAGIPTAAAPGSAAPALASLTAPSIAPEQASAQYPYLTGAHAVTSAEALAAAQADARALAADAPAECAAWLSSPSLQQEFTSQFGQDAAIYYTFFAGKLARGQRGFYVDLGANKPRALSNTWFLDRCLGWGGLCIEADPSLAAGLRASERTCTVVNMCSAATRSELKFVVDGSPDNAGGHVAGPGEQAGTVVVPCAPLHEILTSHGVVHVDLLSLDIEGNEVPALTNNVWEAVPIEMIIVETAWNNEQLDMLIHDGGFWRVNDIGYLDDLYVRGPRLVKNKPYDSLSRKINYEYLAKPEHRAMKRAPAILNVNAANDVIYQRSS